MNTNALRQAQDRIAEAIKALKKTRSEHEEYLKPIETRTRQLLIDPMLEALGWDVRNPAQVHLEYKGTSGKPDYALFSQGNVIALIEAKKLREQPSRIGSQQLVKYATDDSLTSLKYVVWTNGDYWWLWIKGDQYTGEGEAFHISEMSEYECAVKATPLLRSTLEVQEVPPTPEPSSRTPSIRQKAVDSSKSEEQNQGDWEPLTSLKVEKGQKPPANSNIKFPDSSTKPINHWIDVLVSVANYLIETGKISAKNCPVPLKEGSRRHLLHTESIHSTGKEFDCKREIGELWLNTHSDSTNTWKNACWLLERFGVNPSTVLVSTNRS